MKTIVRIAGTSGLAFLCAGSIALAQNNIRPGPNGETDITMSRNCVVTYDAGGYRINSTRGCDGGDVTRADQEYANYRAQFDNRRFGGNRGGNVPGFNNIRTFRNGNTEVTVSSACVALYNSQGYRINNGRCSGDDITRADQQYADYRRYGPDGGSAGGYNPGPAYARMPDNMRIYRNGNTDITMSRDCVITYDARGYRIRSDRGCDGGDITRADQEYDSYRR
jgi:hypothetical protein